MSAVVTGMDAIRLARAESMREHTRMMLMGREAVFRKSLPLLVADVRLSEFHARNTADAAVRDKAREWVKACIAGSPNGLLLVGPNGTGKTWLLAAIGRALLPTERPAVFVSAPDLWADVKHTYGSHEGESERQLLANYKCAPVLLLDELGAGNITEPYRACMADLLCYRANNGHPTVIATNLAPNKIADVTDSRAGDRLSGFVVLPVLGASRRGVK